MEAIRLFIVEEHAAVQQALKLRLQAAPQLHIVGVSSIIPGLALVKAHRPDVIVLGLPHRLLNDPILATASINHLARIAPVIVLAPYAEEQERDMLLQAGAQRYLLKQLHTASLISEIESVAQAAQNKTVINYDSRAAHARFGDSFNLYTNAKLASS